MQPVATYRNSPFHPLPAVSQCVAKKNMGKGFYISKPLGVVGVVLGVGAIATIIALSVVYSQEKAKNNKNDVLPTPGTTVGTVGTTAGTTVGTPVGTTVGTPSQPPVMTTAPSNQPWHKYRLPTNLVPHFYNVTLWPRLEPDNKTNLFIFTGKSSCA